MRTLKIMTEYQPWDDCWLAYDQQTYDGAPDSLHRELGRGDSEAQAIADLLEQLEDADILEA